MLSPKNRRYFLQILPFGLISGIFSLVYVLIEKGILGDSPIYPSTLNPYVFSPWVSIITSLISGWMIGIIEVFYLNRRFNSVSFIKKVFYKTGIYLLILCLFIFINIAVTNTFDYGGNFLDIRVWIDAQRFFSSFAFWSIVIYLGTLISISLFYLEVSDNIGQEVLLNFFTGKYHHPTEEARIFMFLDMKSSTTIAEELGHVRYFNLLQEYYADLSNPIIDHAGEIYQYVGDEIVVSWKLGKGLLKNNCMECFFEMKKKLNHLSEKYEDKFGLSPGFKAGIHFGKVTTGEIGVVKKEIIFTGDVLNATARIQSLCNPFEVNLLISGALKDALSLDRNYLLKDLGETELRGRQEKMKIYSVERNELMLN